MNCIFCQKNETEVSGGRYETVNCGMQFLCAACATKMVMPDSDKYGFGKRPSKRTHEFSAVRNQNRLL